MIVKVKAILLVLIFLPFVSHANDHNTAVLNNLDRGWNLAPHLEIIEDHEHAYSTQDIQSGKLEHLWVQNTKESFMSWKANSSLLLGSLTRQIIG